MDTPPSHALVVMVKAPIPGEVKTRLIPPLTPEDAVGLYRCFIEDTLLRVSTFTLPPTSPHKGGREKVSKEEGLPIFVAYTPPDKEAIIKEVVSSIPLVNGVEGLIPQIGEDLGERLFNTFQRLFSMGYKKVAIIGSDSPDIPLEYIEKTFCDLEEGRIVLGPSEDGGYYLIGMSLGTELNSVPKAIFKDIPWGTAQVLEETLKKIKEAHIEVTILPTWYDVDNPHDIKKLQLEILPRTSKFIQTNLCNKL
ncbi:MAG: TIGR04282 family arsenosugar biosynthesis glycosyltransferase [Deltaproteobacteria bacterium]|nr:TIGR04282 family arsenosugar biosynthesis glycosyltransferase [Deltaproteobacteria bacterium]